jgi:hypothetical protein
MNVTTILTLFMVATLQFDVPSGIDPGTPEAAKYSYMIMFWAPSAVCLQKLGFRVSL